MIGRENIRPSAVQLVFCIAGSEGPAQLVQRPPDAMASSVHCIFTRGRDVALSSRFNRHRKCSEYRCSSYVELELQLNRVGLPLALNKPMPLASVAITMPPFVFNRPLFTENCGSGNWNHYEKKTFQDRGRHHSVR